MDKDKYDFFKKKSKSKGSKNSNSAKGQVPQSHFDPTMPFNSTASSVESIASTGLPALPMPLTSTGTTWEWEYQGYRVRNYIAGGFWVCENGDDAFLVRVDWSKKMITEIKPLSIKATANGRYYVEAYKDKQLKMSYIEDAINVCFKGGNTSTPFSTTPTQTPVVSTPQTPASTQPVNTTVIPPQPKKLNVSLIPYQGNDYGFYYNDKIFVSQKNGLVVWLNMHWPTKTYSKAIPYNICHRPDGSKYVMKKQEDGSYKEIDIATAVCSTFNGKPLDPNQVVKFKDGNVGNCDADNLYWG